VHRIVLKNHGVEMLAGVEYVRIDDAGLHIRVGGADRLLAVDHVVICAGQEPVRDVAPLDARGAVTRADFHLVGGAHVASELDARRAIREAAELAASL
jgi:2,4-dienoyl-CoA reductase (NADPH2)